MFVSFFESIKYMGHLWPIALIRIYLGTFFLEKGIRHIREGILKDPVFDTTLQKLVLESHSNYRFLMAFQNWVSNHWALASQIAVVAFVAIGICYIIGFLVRPAAIVAIALSLNFMASADVETYNFAKIFVALNATFFLIAAGRCFGFDYYFYKRVRGVWW